MNERTKITWWRYALAVVAYAVLFFVGGFVLVLWNALSPRAYRYVPGDLGYTIMQVLTGPAGIVIANYAVTSLLQDKRSILPFVLNVVGAAFAAFICLFPLIATGDFTLNTLSTLLAGFTAGVYAWHCFKDYSKSDEKGGNDGQAT